MKSSCSETSSPGCFVCLEGGDGVGKTTLTERLTAWVIAQGKTACALTPSMFSPEAMAIRRLMLDPQYNFTDTSLALLFTAQRALLADMLRPLLEEYDVVFCDRWVMSTLAYQGHAGNAPLGMILDCHRAAVGINPAVSILLDLDPEIGMQRKHQQGGGLDTFEKRDLSFHHKIRKAYLELAEQMSYTIVDASWSEDEVFEQVKHRCMTSVTFLRAVQLSCLQPSKSSGGPLKESTTAVS